MEVKGMRGKILVVDDDPSALRLISYTLRVEGYEVVTAENGSQALAAVAQEYPALVVLDVMMPGMSGLEVCHRLRASPHTAHMPILMLSAKGKVEDRVTGLRAGADDYVPKPVDPSELVARVEALMLRANRSAPPRPRARVLAFLGAKGGVGTTTVAVNVALAMAQQGADVIVADLHPHLGTVCPLMGLDPPHSLAGLAEVEPASIHPRDIEGRLVRHVDGARVLTSRRDALSESQAELSAEHVEAILNGLSTMADVVVLDLPLDLTSVGRSALARCDMVALVTEADRIAVECARRQLALLRQAGIMGELVAVVVVNRSSPVSTMTPVELQRLLGVSKLAMVPQAREVCAEAVQRGVPLVVSQPDHLAVRILRQLAQRLAEERVTTPSG